MDLDRVLPLLPIRKYRHAGDVPPPPRVAADDPRLYDRLRAVCSLPEVFDFPASPEGLRKFRSMEEANAYRDELVRQRIRAIAEQRRRARPERLGTE